MQLGKIIICMCLLFLNLSCSNNEEQKKLGEAQACLDKVPQTPVTATVAAANKCYSYISSVSGPQADSLRCSIGFLAAGITTTKLVQAVKKINENDSAAEEAFISTLVFNGFDPDNTATAANGEQALINVKQAASYCNASGVKGLMYLGNFAVAGTALVKSIKGAGADVFWEDPNYDSIQGQIAGAITNCANKTTDCDPEDVGAAIIALSESYCSSGKEDDDQCQQVQAAIAAGNGDPAAVGTAFYEQLKNN
ncbi:MAG: hypothetical protein KDD40_12755 [Bdellovibrionales bacterium]|nr:hypothetical protein [Bdellovibrionales bacterium]